MPDDNTIEPRPTSFKYIDAPMPTDPQCAECGKAIRGDQLWRYGATHEERLHSDCFKQQLQVVSQRPSTAIPQPAVVETEPPLGPPFPEPLTARPPAATLKLKLAAAKGLVTEALKSGDTNIFLLGTALFEVIEYLEINPKDADQ